MQFLSAISVGVKAAGEFLAKPAIAKIGTTTSGPASLVVTRLKDAEIKLVDAVAALAEALKGG